jgi:hypothetical protein
MEAQNGDGALKHDVHGFARVHFMTLWGHEFVVLYLSFVTYMP